MFLKIKGEIGPNNALTVWNYLVQQERLLRRNRKVCRIVQPLSTLIFLLNLLLVTVNFARFLLGGLVEDFFAQMPLLGGWTQGFPRGSWGGVIAFSLCFAYLIPLAVSALVWGAFLLWERAKGTKSPEPLNGTPQQQAKALTCRAEVVYELRRQIPDRSVYVQAGILTVISAIPVGISCLRAAGGDSPAVLQFSLYCFALLVVLFMLYWVYVLLIQGFAQLNGLFYFSRSEWHYYELYQKADAYWESIDEGEYARREEQRRWAEKQKKRT